MTENLSLPASPLSHVVTRLRASELITEPYPHYYLEHVFPDEYYKAMLEHLPASGVYQNLYEVTDLKLDHFRHRDQRNLDDGWTEALPPELKGFWDHFDEWFLGSELARAVLRSFAAPLRARFGDEESWPEVSVEAQLIRHRAGYFLGPHSDLHTKLAVLLIYLAPDESGAHLGTSIYRPKEPGFSCRNSTHYPFADFVRVKTTPYKPNSLLAFLRSDTSFHGVESISEQDVNSQGRDLIQYVLHDKRAREAQLRARRMAASEGDAA
ncbi:MAG: hypothetical protein QOE33_106 [Acidobacteriota bacterium]|nr:hypothetical protein [Acidobacteriota bacterium]